MVFEKKLCKLMTFNAYLKNRHFSPDLKVKNQYESSQFFSALLFDLTKIFHGTILTLAWNFRENIIYYTVQKQKNNVDLNLLTLCTYVWV